jgi:hypothetical protein
MKITNNQNLPEGFVKAVSVEKHNAPGSLSATTLIQGLKQVILTDRHWDSLQDDVSERIWAIWGQAVHSLLEHEGESDFTEQELSYPVGSITVTGKIDNYNMATGTICDYKTASINKVRFSDFSEWYLQGMIYAWLLKKNGFDVKHCRFITLLKDHSKSEAVRDRSYPQRPLHVYEFQVTLVGLMKIDSFIKNRIREYESYQSLHDNDIPPCTPEERWEKASKFAVMKQGRKTAVRLFDEKAEAESMAAELGNPHYVEIRQGESKRCNHYCLCCQFCNFYNRSLNSNELAKAA